MIMKRHFIFLAVVLLFLTGVKSNAQSAEQRVSVTLESPYNTVLVHLQYLQPNQYAPATAARTLAGVTDSARASRLAIQLKQVYDGEGLYVPVGQIPQNPNYFDSTREASQYLPFPDQLPQVYLEKIDGQWFYSRETLSQIPGLHKQVYPFGADILVNMLPSGGQQYLGLFAWQYLGLLIVGLIVILLHLIIRRLLIPLVRKLSSSKLYPSLIPRRIIRQLAGYISVWIVIRVLFLLLPPLQLPIEASQFVMLILRLISVVLVVLAAYRVIEIVALYIHKASSRTESKMDDQLVPLIKRGLQAVVVVFAFFNILKLLDFDPTALIAGISIGGLAIALAAQDTVKNLFGSFTIFFDKPFQVGDWINFGDVHGTVEEVGFRSTRVRTFEDSLVYVPNGKLADMVINNYGLRVYRRFKTNLALTYDTPPDLIEAYVEGLRDIVKNYPTTRKDYFEIHLNELATDSLQILVYIFFEAPSYSVELRSRHEILMATLELAKILGVRFAFPTTTLHIEEFPGQVANTPTYQTGQATIEERREQFLTHFRKKYTAQT